MKKVLMLSMVVLCFMAVHSYGSLVVNLDFERDTATGGTSGAGFVGQGPVADAGNDHWNRIELPMELGPTFQPTGYAISGLLASDGTTASSMGVTLKNFYRAFDQLTTENDLQTDRILANTTIAGSEVGTIEITGLDNAKTYDVYVVVGRDVWPTLVSFGGTDKVGSGGFAGPAAAPVWVEDTHYVKFTGLTAIAGVISGTVTGSGQKWGAVSGIQVVEVPEPATMVLLGLGSLLGFRRKK